MKRHKRGHSNQSPARPHTGSKPRTDRSKPAESPAPESDSLFPTHRWLLGVLLFVLVLVAYLPVARSGFVWGDDSHVINNSLLTAPDGLNKIWFSAESPSEYAPLAYSVLRLERQLWGLKPAGYHWVNILLHGLNALLLWQLLRRLAIPGCWLAAALFALHPVNVESVAWITEFSNILSLCFCLLAVFAWIRVLNAPQGRASQPLLLTIVFYALALFSKTTACTLPVALFLVMWIKGVPIDRRSLTRLVPFTAMSIAMASVALWWKQNNVSALDNMTPLSLLERVLVASHALWFHLGKLLWPVNLAFNYPRFALDAANPLAYGWLVALIVLGIVVWRSRSRFGRGPASAALFYVVTLSPLLGFIMLDAFRWSFVADHYQYLACIGPLTLAAAGIAKGLAAMQQEARTVRPFAFGAMLLALAVLTWRQCGIYTNSKTLWSTTLARNPASWLAHVNLGNIQLEEGATREAFDHYHQATRLQPNDATILFNLGYAYRKVGDSDMALLYLQRSLQFQPRSPDALNSFAAVLLQQGRVYEAISNYQALIAVRPLYTEAQHNLGVAYFQTDRLDDAIAQFRRAIAIDPSLAEAHKGLGKALFQKRRVDEAFAEFQTVLQLQPDQADVHEDVGSMLLSVGKINDAIAHFQRALELRPGYEEACLSLGRMAWLLATHPDPKVRNGGKAIELTMLVQRYVGPDNPGLTATLAAAYAEAGRFPDAVTAATRSLELATAQDNQPMVESVRVQLEEYRAGRPFRDSSRSP